MTSMNRLVFILFVLCFAAPAFASDCWKIKDPDKRALCQDECWKIKNRDLRYLCEGKCDFIRDNDLRTLCKERDKGQGKK